MQKRLCLMLAFLSAMVLGAWADGASSFGGGDGSAKNPYIIRTAAQWDQFASNVNGGTTYSGMYFQLDADITVTTMVGAGTKSKDAKPFNGTFDGGGHTLTFNHTATEEEGDIAPFRFVRNATICNLHVAGEIITAYRHAGGLAGRTYGTTLIRNCRVSTVIKSSCSGDGTHGGIVALKPDYNSANLTIEGCVYDGKIVSIGTGATTHCAGLVGYTSYGSLTIKNSIYVPAAPSSGETAVNSQYTFYRYSGTHPGTITLTNCYYFETLGDAQGKHARSIGFDEGVDIHVVPTGEATDYGVSDITGYAGNQCVKYNNVVYAGSGDEVALTFSHNYAGVTVSGYYVKSGGATLADNGTDGYTLTMADANVIFSYETMEGDRPIIVGNGTSDSPFQIRSSREWDYIVSLVNSHTGNYPWSYYKLTADITVTTMMGSDGRRFGGHFDGGIYDNENNLIGYHTLTVNYDTDEQYAAPFRYVDGAKISNLRVAGTIKTSKKFAAGFIANDKGTTELNNCRSSVSINSSVNGDGTHGGFVAHNTGGALIFRGCAFDGYMLGGNTNGCAGFVGWNETTNGANGTVSITNCLFAPKGTQMVIEKVFVRSGSYASGVIWITNSHCTAHYNVDQQSRVYSITTDENVSMTYYGDNPTTYSVSGITCYTVGLTFDGVLYAKENDQLTLTLAHTGTPSSGSYFNSYATTAGSLSGNTLTMANANATIYAIYGDTPLAWSGSGSGTLESPYIISTPALWNEFANNVNSGVNGFSTAYYQLAADITVTTMVGTEGHRFQGHFDGGSKTLTLSYGTEAAPFNEDYCAPFRYIEGAEISNLTVGGTIYTKKQFAAGIAGYALNNNAITDCRSSVTINSSVSGDGTHGGFVAHCQNNTDGETYVTFTRCAFDGKLLGTTTNKCGGFVGWTESHNWAGVKVVDCIFAPNKVSVLSDGSATFSRGQDNNKERITVEHSYYTQYLGTRQGEMAYTAQPADVTTEALTIAGVTVYVKKTVVTNVAATSITPTTATISWTGTEACSNYQVRYRSKDDTYSYYTGFEDGMPDGWTMFDNDNDNYNWTYYGGPDHTMPHKGSGCMYSASYINNFGPLEPDNWLVSPQLELDGTMKVWLKSQDDDDYMEHFAIYLSTTGGSKSDFIDASGNLQSGVVTLVPETETTDEYQEYTADLSAYSGQGYIAIRHFNCYNQFYLVVDDFSIYKVNADDKWATVSGGLPAGTTITGLTPATTYEYQIDYDYGGMTFYTSTADLTTLAEDVAPTDLKATSISANTATISWTGYGDSYNLRYGKGGVANVTLSVPNDIWEDDSGYQMLLDANHNTYGTVIPETGGLTISGNASAETYANFEYKIPENADGNLNTKNVVNGTTVTSITITIPAGTYDWCITNPSPNDRVWIATEHGNIAGRQNDFTFEADKHYTFTIALDNNSGNDCVNMSVEADETLVTDDVTNVTGITSTSYNLSNLTASTFYTVYVQSVKGDKTSEWSSICFTTLNEGELYLYDDQDNSTALASYAGQTAKVTLQDRTLYKDGAWNTLCLPFDVTDGDTDTSYSPANGGRDGITFTDTPLEDAEVMGFDHASFDSATGTLEIVFCQVYEVHAGEPFLVRWTKAAPSDPDLDDLVDPVFTGVTITAKVPQTVDPEGYAAAFVGTYAPVNIYTEAKTNLYLGADNKLYYPDTEGFKVNACRAYFYLKNGLTAGEPSSPGEHSVRTFVLNFGDGETGIVSIENGKWKMENEAGAWHDLNGRQLSGKPTRKGLYIHGGRKVVIK